MAKKTKELEKKLIGFSVIVLVIGVVAGYGLRNLQSSYAAPKPKTNSGSCYASPNPASFYKTFTVYISGVPPNTILGVYTVDAGGSGWVSTQSDASGNASVNDPYTARVGQSTIYVKTSDRRPITLATCYVTVQ